LVYRLKKLRAYLNRRRYVFAMMRAIHKATYNVWGGPRSSKTDGLRVIRSFERINKIPFDPFDHYHVHIVNGNGRHEHFFRMTRLMFQRWKEAA
jgi:hypothetical protein